MSNMGYCRFHNTLSDLNDCLRAIQDGEAEDDELSADEKYAKKQLIATCKEIIREIEGDF